MTDVSLSPSWFEEHIGKVVFRNPVYEFENGQKMVPVKIRDIEHAHVLYDIHVANKTIYRDNETE
jgi:hypothetical protein